MSIPARSHRQPTPLKQFLYGSPYYPEHWDADIRARDPELFAAAGWNAIRMAEFAWDVMEPEEGRFDFSLFDDTIARFGAVGIRTILCTPTATPPRWLTLKHPEILRIDADGRAQLHGSRQHASHFSPVFREYSRRITRAMAAHFADNPHVIGWQTDNEFHCHFSEDHSPASETAFVEFLRARHRDIAALNRAWGTAFWAQTYPRFEGIPTPRPNRPTYCNPAHVLDYYRHLSHGVAVFQRDQVEILRAANQRWFVTHNGCFRLIDFAGEFGADLDFLSYDAYPMFNYTASARPASQAFNTDYSRSFGGNLLIMEQQSGPGGQGDYFHDNPEPGEMRRMAYANIARGADGNLFFRERSCRFGAEEYWCGIIDHDNVPRRRYREAAQLGAELRRVGPAVLGTSVHVDIGIAAGDFDSLHGHLPLSHGLPSPKQVAETIHLYLYHAGHAVGCVHPGDTLDGLRVYFVPHLAQFNPAWIPAWTRWIEAGGVLIIGARTGSKDLDNNVVAETLPGALRSLVGATVEEYGRQNRPDLRPLAIQLANQTPTPTDLWYETLRPDAGTEVLATWTGRHLAGEPAITLRRHGRGAVIYVGTYFTTPVMDALAPLLARLGLTTPTNVIPGVERTLRVSTDKRLHFILNHNEHSVEVPAPACNGHDLVSDRPVPANTTLHLAPWDVAVISETN